MSWHTYQSTSRGVVVAAAILLAAACSEPQRAVAPGAEQTSAATPRFTLHSGYASALLGRSSLADGFKVKRRTGTWEMDIHAKDPTDIVVASLNIEAGGHSGWHSHPGPGFVQVTSGTVRFYEAGDPSCAPTIVSAGQAWLDRGDIPHIVRNETGAPATLLVTVFLPPGGVPRIDEPAPGNCPF